jgi:hypothetical protein
MAHLHFRVTTYKSGGTAASGRVAYITRTPVHKIGRADQQLRYIQEGREDLIYTRSRNLPAWAENAHTYFQAAERHEGKNRVAFTELKISLPVELTRRQNMGLMHDLVDAIAGDTLPCTYAFHAPRTLTDSSQQPHLHVLISARRNDEHSRTPAQHFKRFNRAEPWHGGAEKDPASWHMGAVKAQRQMISDVINMHLETAGVAARVDPRTLEDRDIPREAEPKLLPSESRAYREGGIISERMQQVLTIRAERAVHMQREQEHARDYWHTRKSELGMTRDMPREVQLAHMRQAREQAVTCVPARIPVHELAHQAHELRHSISGLERYSNQLRNELVIEGHYRHDYQRPQSGQWSAERVLAEGKAHGLPRDYQAERAVATFARALDHLSREQEPQPGAALRMRIFGRDEHERDQGQGWGF